MLKLQVDNVKQELKLEATSEPDIKAEPDIKTEPTFGTPSPSKTSFLVGNTFAGQKALSIANRDIVADLDLISSLPRSNEGTPDPRVETEHNGHQLPPTKQPPFFSSKTKSDRLESPFSKHSPKPQPRTSLPEPEHDLTLQRQYEALENEPNPDYQGFVVSMPVPWCSRMVPAQPWGERPTIEKPKKEVVVKTEDGNVRIKQEEVDGDEDAGSGSPNWGGGF